jgi:hypothetical protein
MLRDASGFLRKGHSHFRRRAADVCPEARLPDSRRCPARRAVCLFFFLGGVVTFAARVGDQQQGAVRARSMMSFRSSAAVLSRVRWPATISSYAALSSAAWDWVGTSK